MVQKGRLEPQSLAELFAGSVGLRQLADRPLPALTDAPLTTPAKRPRLGPCSNSSSSRSQSKRCAATIASDDDLYPSNLANMLAAEMPEQNPDMDGPSCVPEAGSGMHAAEPEQEEEGAIQ